MDYEIQRCTRHCATTGRELAPGESFYSTLAAQGAELVRRDYSTEAWTGPPEGIVGWWKSQMPDPRARRAQMAPNDVILELFDQLADQPDMPDDECPIAKSDSQQAVRRHRHHLGIPADSRRPD